MSKSFVLGFDAKRAFNNYTGLGSYSRNLLRGLWRYHPQQQTILFSPKVSIDRFYQECCLQERAKVYLSKHWWAKRGPIWKRETLFDSMRSHDHVDLYHGPSHSIPHFSSKLKGYGRCKWVVTIHDLIFLRHPEYFPWIDAQLYYWEFRRSCEQSDGIIAVSESTKADIIHYFGIPEEKIRVIYQCIPEEMFDRPPTVTLENASPREDSYFLYLGTLNARKNALSVVLAYEQMMNQEKDLPKLILVGSMTAYGRKIQSYIKKRGLTQWIEMKGAIPQAQLAQIYSKALCMIYPSFYEGFGLPLIEAQAFGVPVVASKTSSLPEAAGPHALLCNPERPEELANQMTKVLNDATLRQRLSLQGQEYAKKFHPKLRVREVYDFYLDLLDS